MGGGIRVKRNGDMGIKADRSKGKNIMGGNGVGSGGGLRVSGFFGFAQDDGFWVGCCWGALVAFDDEGDAVFGAEADGWIGGDLGGGSGLGAEVPVAGDGGEGEDAFHPGEAFADALA